MKSQPRKMWEELSVVNTYRIDKGKFLVVVIGADDPTYLEIDEKAKAMATKEAKKLGYPKLRKVGEIGRFGQNELTLQRFYFKKD